MSRSPGRVCVLCGAPLNGSRPDARHCGPACRREASRLRALLSGDEVEGINSVVGYLPRLQKRAKRQRRPSERSQSTR
jgi:hypothetical protein